MLKSILIRALTLFTVGGVLTAVSAAQSGRYWQNPFPTGNTLRAVAALDDQTVIAVGDYGTILRTTDGGETWTLQSSGTTSHLYGVSFTDANTGTAVGDRGPILRITTGGDGRSRRNFGASAAMMNSPAFGTNTSDPGVRTMLLSAKVRF